MDASLLFLSPQGFGPDRVAGRGTDLGAGAAPEAPGLFARALSDATEAGSEPAPVPAPAPALALAAGVTGATDQGTAPANLPMPVSLPMPMSTQMQMQMPLAMPSSASALATSPTAAPPRAAPIGPGTQLPGPGASAAAAHRVALADVAGVTDDVVSAVLPEPSSPSSPVDDDQETGATSGPDMALMQWMLQMVPQAPAPTAPTAPPTPVAEPSSARPGLQQGAAPPLAMLAAGLSGRPEPGGRDGPAPRDAGRGGSAPVAGTAGVLTRAAGLATLKTMALPDAEVRRVDSPARAPVAGATPAAALAPSRPEPVTSNALSGWSASTADTQALSPAAAQAAAAAAAAPTAVAASAGSPVSPPVQAWIRTPVTQPGFTNEVVVALVRDVSQAEPGSHALTLHLNPEALGPVSVSIEMQGSTARIEFSASEALTRQHLESALPELHQALQDHGVSLTQSGVHEASKESLAASAAGSQTSGGAGSDARQRGEAPFDGRSGYGERAPRWETEVFSVDGSAMADSNARAQASRGPSPGRAGRLDLFA